MTGFDAATTVRRRADSGVYDAALHPSWGIYGKPNGGYLLAILTRAACETVGAHDAVAVSAHYLRAADPGPVEVRTEAIRLGRRVSTARSTLWQNDKPHIEALVTCGQLQNTEAEWDDAQRPAMPPPEECVDPGTATFRPEIYDVAELRIDPATAPFPTPSGEPRVRFWFRLRDGSAPSALAAMMALDLGPPTVFNLAKLGWAPTVELSVLMRGVPAEGWMLVESHSRVVSGDGWFDEEACVWDSTGRLIAQSRQLALAAPPS